MPPLAAWDTSQLLAEARGLSAARRHREAKAAYLALLHRAPTHLAGLSELGALAYAGDHRSAARTIYKQMVQVHPREPGGWVNLGIIHYEDGAFAAARSAFEMALSIDSDLKEAHRGLAQVLLEQGEPGHAERHWRESFPGQAIALRDYHGPEPATHVLFLISVKGGNIPLNHIFDGYGFKMTILYVEYYKADYSLPPHDVVFNAIGDADLCRSALLTAESVLSQTTAPVINAPSRVLKTGRLENAARLGALPDVRAPCIREMQRIDIAKQAEFPILLRTPGYHTGQHFLKVDCKQDLEGACAALPGNEILAIEYLDARSADGLVRKYRVMVIGGKLYPLHLAISANWKVHYFTADMADNESHRAEERRFLEDMPAVIGARAMAALERIAEALGLDYAGIDFALKPDGTLLLFEANATMLIRPPTADCKWNYRREAGRRARDAANALPLAPRRSLSWP
ncbi:MAG: hypothetical protein ACREFW_10465 [Rhizomicrobium sp.]